MKENNELETAEVFPEKCFRKNFVKSTHLVLNYTICSFYEFFLSIVRVKIQNLQTVLVCVQNKRLTLNCQQIILLSILILSPVITATNQHTFQFDTQSNIIGSKETRCEYEIMSYNPCQYEKD